VERVEAPRKFAGGGVDGGRLDFDFGRGPRLGVVTASPLPRPANAGWWKRHLADTALHVGAASADMLSSRGMYELNPVLGRGPFGTRQVAISASIVGGIELTKWVLARRYPRSRVVRAMSLVPAALRGGVAARNWRVR
jgi:hypothetical protein